MAHYIAEHRVGPKSGKHMGIDRVEQFEDLDEAKRACDRWQRTGCLQAIIEIATGVRLVRIDLDGEWVRS